MSLASQSGPEDRPQAEDAWRALAACQGMDTGLFFPARGEPVSRAVRETCASCPVRLQCLEAAIEANERFGFWGGLSTEARDHVRRQRVLARGRSTRLGLAPAANA